VLIRQVTPMNTNTYVFICISLFVLECLMVKSVGITEKEKKGVFIRNEMHMYKYYNLINI
jgi:hypothetical protein